MRLNKRLAIIVLIVISAPFVFIQSSVDNTNAHHKINTTAESPPSPYIAALISSYDSIVTQSVHQTPGAAVIIVRGDSILFAKGYGVRSVITNEPVDTNTIFRIGSLSKGIASILAGIIVEDSLLSYEDNVSDYLNYYLLKSESNTHHLKVKHLLSQSTGLPKQAYSTMIEEGVERDKMINSLQGLNPIGNPGQHYSYQNVGYSIIEPILEKVTGQRFEKLLQDRVFDPLSMESSSANLSGIMLSHTRAMPHISYRDTWQQTELSPTYYNTQAAGGINASIQDMGQYLKLLLGHRPDIISYASLAKLYTPHTRTFIDKKYFGNWKKSKKSHYGLGFRIVQNGDDKVIYHGGYVNDFTSRIALIPSEDIGICILTNSKNKFITHAVPDFLTLYDQYREKLDIRPQTSGGSRQRQ